MDRFNISLPPDLADKLREHVTSGEYRDESEVIADALRQMDEAPDPALESWLRTEVVAAYERMKAYPETGRTAEQVRASLRTAREARSIVRRA